MQFFSSLIIVIVVPCVLQVSNEVPTDDSGLRAPPTGGGWNGEARVADEERSEQPPPQGWDSGPVRLIL